MKFSLNYTSPRKQEADEIKCPLNQLRLIYDFIKNNPDKRYLILLTKDQINLEKIQEQVLLVKELTENYTLSCPDITTFHLIRAANYNAHLAFPVTDWESFSQLASLHASDIYIDGPLGFQTDSLKIGKQNTKIRISPQISPNALINTSNSNITSFFIRPEDLHLYEDAIDIIDFNVKDQEKEDTLFKIYKRGTYKLELSTLIEHLNEKVPNLFLRPDFGENRLNCGQHCRIPGRSCHMCETQFILTNTMIQYFEKFN